jgi:hypothetical protein
MPTSYEDRIEEQAAAPPDDLSCVGDGSGALVPTASAPVSSSSIRGIVRRWLVGSMAVAGLSVVVLVSAASSPARAIVPPDAAAEVIGQSITVTTFDHWMRVAAKASAAPGSVVVIPLQPPGFASCLAQVRKKLHRLARDSNAKIKLYCHRLFRSLNSVVLDFLIKAHWYEAAAAGRGIVFTGQQITAKFDQEKRQQFATAGAFRTFLRQTGQTIADIRFRVRLNLIYEALIKREGGKASIVEAQARQAYQAGTLCARYYVMDDCAAAK